MAHAYYHAKSSARRFGGEASDYLEYHEFLDQTKLHCADARHRLVLHNAFGIGLAERVLEQHILEDLGRIPSLEQCLAQVTLEPWMYRNAEQLSKKDEESNDDSEHTKQTATSAVS